MQNSVDGFFGGTTIPQSVLATDFDNPNDPFGDNFSGSPFAQNLEGNVAPGDSGGALFIGGQLAGVISFLGSVDGNGNADYGDVSGYTRVSTFNTWIDEQIAANSVPEPSTYFLSLIAILSIGYRRNKK